MSVPDRKAAKLCGVSVTTRVVGIAYHSSALKKRRLLRLRKIFRLLTGKAPLYWLSIRNAPPHILLIR